MSYFVMSNSEEFLEISPKTKVQILFICIYDLKHFFAKYTKRCFFMYNQIKIDQLKVYELWKR